MYNVKAMPLNVLRRIRQVVVLSLHAYFSSRIEYVFVTGTCNIYHCHHNTSNKYTGRSLVYIQVNKPSYTPTIMCG